MKSTNSRNQIDPGPTGFGRDRSRKNPTIAHLQYFLVVSAYTTAWFVLMYGVCDWITSLHSFRVSLAMPWESKVPYWPPAVVAYMSICPLFGLIPFVVPTREDLRRVAVAMNTLIGASAIGFLLLPASGNCVARDASGWTWLINIADTINLTYNYAPSLHVGLSVASVAAMTRFTTRTMGGLLWVWALAVAASTLVLHQHYVVDVITGWLLALICVRKCFFQVEETRLLDADSSPGKPA